MPYCCHRDAPWTNAMHARATWPDANIVYNFGHYGGHVPAALRFIYTVKTLLVEEELGL